jgi:hypothetical protein
MCKKTLKTVESSPNETDERRYYES